jgi:3-oxoacyl-[acyl-carrier-protein] synthase II
MRHRVVVTGVGVVSSIGTGASAFTAALRAGRSGASTIRAFDTTDFPSDQACEVRDFEPHRWVTRLDVSAIGRTSQLAIAASHMAVEDAGVDPASLGPIRCGVSIGTTDGETLLIERFTSEWVTSGPGGFDASYMREAPAGRIPVNVAKELGLTGEVMTFATACAAGNYAIGYGYDLISTGEAACMLCGGADSLSRKTFAGFSRLNAVAPHICQPFDRGRRGLLTGEGAGILVIEARDRALARGARIYAEVLGYGMSCDAVHMTSPDRDSIASAFRKAHASAGVQPSQVDYICAHGTGTRVNDQIESAAIAQVFGTQPPPVSSIKSMIGHTMGAASAIAAIGCAVGIHHRFIPPTIGFAEPDPDCVADCVPNYARDAELRVVQNNAFAFGGNNAILMLGEPSWADQHLQAVS